MSENEIPAGLQVGREMDCHDCATFLFCDPCDYSAWLDCEDFEPNPIKRDLIIELHRALCEDDEEGAKAAECKLIEEAKRE